MAVIVGTLGSEALTGTDPDNTIYGLDGNDAITGNQGIDHLYGGDGQDSIYGGGGGDILYGDDNDDSLYGGDGADTLNGGDGADKLDGGTGADILQGGRGNDIYYVDDPGDRVDETGGNGDDTVKSSVNDYTLPPGVESLFLVQGSAAKNGTGNNLDNQIIGNNQDNTLSGGGGNDRLVGNGGTDHLVGGSGDDVYFIDDGTDIVDETTNGADSGGKDTVYTEVSLDLTDILHVRGRIEHIILDGFKNINATGDAFDNTIDGNDGKNTLTGGGGNDHLYGGGGADTLIGGSGKDYLDGGTGVDTMTGGGGDDSYVVDENTDKITETVDGGTADTVYSSATHYVLADFVENVVLTGHGNIDGDGNAGDNSMTGNDGKNTIRGLDGADKIFGGGDEDSLYGGDGADALYGGAGTDILDGGSNADTMSGGKDDDTYYVDNAGDKVIEKAKEGNDTVIAAIDFVLGKNVENLTLQGTATKGTGNALDNTIVGDDKDNILIGGAGNDVLEGGKGGDHLYGGKGNDTYFIDNAGDVVDETGGNGKDTVFAVIDNYTLGTGIENLMLLGSTPITGTGNGLANVISGNGNANVLYGLAGNDTLDGDFGADHLYGGTGNDTYVIDNSGDIVDESTGGGRDIDTVMSHISASLADTLHFIGAVENLTLTGINDLNGTGNNLANVLTGNAGANILDGGDGNDTLYGQAGNDRLIGGNGNDRLHGGLDHDILTGGAGKDYFYFDTKPNTLYNTDHIIDFESGIDRIELSHKIFTKLKAGALLKTAFVANSTGLAQHKTDRVIYNSGNGKLYYDDDGTGKHAAVLIAVLDNHAKLTASDFHIF
nr:calcium-binding protein [uncultured Gellertiella sp.]